MVQEIATAYGLAMTEEDGGWYRFAGGAAVVANGTAERSVTVPYGCILAPNFLP